jgi:hypothetical protein
MSQGEVVEEWVSLDDLYHPHTPEHFDPNCCCAYCLDVSIAKARRETAKMYRDLRREGKGKIAKLLWKKLKAAQRIYTNRMAENLFSSSSSPKPVGGLSSLFWDLPNK